MPPVYQTVLLGGMVGTYPFLWGRGTVFPTVPAPVAGDRFTRSDRGIDYEWDGTRWLSVALYSEQLFSSAAFQPFAITAGAEDRLSAPYAGIYDLWLVDYQPVFFVTGGAPLDALNKWVGIFYKAATPLATVNIDSGALNTWRAPGPIAIGALLGIANLEFETNYTLTGGAGTLRSLPRLTYRYVG